MSGPFNPFKILNLVGNSVELYTEELKKRGSFYKHKKGVKFSRR